MDENLKKKVKKNTLEFKNVKKTDAVNANNVLVQPKTEDKKSNIKKQDEDFEVIGLDKIKELETPETNVAIVRKMFGSKEQWDSFEEDVKKTFEDTDSQFVYVTDKDKEELDKEEEENRQKEKKKKIKEERKNRKDARKQGFEYVSEFDAAHIKEEMKAEEEAKEKRRQEEIESAYELSEDEEVHKKKADYNQTDKFDDIKELSYDDLMDEKTKKAVEKARKSKIKRKWGEPRYVGLDKKYAFLKNDDSREMARIKDRLAEYHEALNKEKLGEKVDVDGALSNIVSACKLYTSLRYRRVPLRLLGALTGVGMFSFVKFCSRWKEVNALKKEAQNEIYKRRGYKKAEADSDGRKLLFDGEKSSQKIKYEYTSKKNAYIDNVKDVPDALKIGALSLLRVLVENPLRIAYNVVAVPAWAVNEGIRKVVKWSGHEPQRHIKFAGVYWLKEYATRYVHHRAKKKIMNNTKGHWYDRFFTDYHTRDQEIIDRAKIDMDMINYDYGVEDNPDVWEDFKKYAKPETEKERKAYELERELKQKELDRANEAARAIERNEAIAMENAEKEKVEKLQRQREKEEFYQRLHKREWEKLRKKETEEAEKNARKNKRINEDKTGEIVADSTAVREDLDEQHKSFEERKQQKLEAQRKKKEEQEEKEREELKKVEIIEGLQAVEQDIAEQKQRFEEKKKQKLEAQRKKKEEQAKKEKEEKERKLKEEQEKKEKEEQERKLKEEQEKKEKEEKERKLKEEQERKLKEEQEKKEKEEREKNKNKEQPDNWIIVEGTAEEMKQDNKKGNAAADEKQKWKEFERKAKALKENLKKAEADYKVKNKTKFAALKKLEPGIKEREKWLEANAMKYRTNEYKKVQDELALMRIEAYSITAYDYTDDYDAKFKFDETSFTLENKLKYENFLRNNGFSVGKTIEANSFYRGQLSKLDPLSMKYYWMPGVSEEARYAYCWLGQYYQAKNTTLVKEGEEKEEPTVNMPDYHITLEDADQIHKEYEKQPSGSYNCFCCSGAELVRQFCRTEGRPDKGVDQWSIRDFKPKFKTYEDYKNQLLEINPDTDSNVFKNDVAQVKSYLAGDNVGNIFELGDFFLEHQPDAMLNKVSFNWSVPQGKLTKEKKEKLLKNYSNIKAVFFKKVYQALKEKRAVSVLIQSPKHYLTIVGLDGKNIKYVDSLSNHRGSIQTGTFEEDFLTSRSGGLEIVWMSKMKKPEELQKEYKTLGYSKEKGFENLDPSMEDFTLVAQTKGVYVAKEEKDMEDQVSGVRECIYIPKYMPAGAQ